MNLFHFEFQKIILNRKFVIVLLLIIVSVAFMFFRNESLQIEISKEKSALIEKQLTDSFRNSEEHIHNLNLRPSDNEEKDLQRINSSIITVLYELRNIIYEDQWQQELQLQNKRYDLTLEYISKGGESFYYPSTLEKEIAINDKLLTEGIPPEHDQYSVARANFMKVIVDIFILFSAIVIIFLIIGEAITAEFENHSVNLLFTQPLNRANLFASKFIHSIIIFVVITGTLLATAFILGSFFGEKGTFNYPVIIEKSSGFEFITIFQYIVQSLLCLSVFILMIIALYYFISLLARKVLPALFILLVILGFGYVLTALGSSSLLDWANPFQYLLINEAITMQTTSNWYSGIPVALFVTILFYLLSLNTIKRAKIE